VDYIATSPIDLNSTNGILASPREFFITNKIKELYPNLRILETQSMEEAFSAVANNRAQFVITDESIGLFFIYNSKISNITITETTRPLFELSLPIRVLIPKQNPLLFSIINKAHDNLPSLTLERLKERWMEEVEYSVALTQEEKEWIRNSGPIRVQVSSDNMPYDFIENGQAQGYSTELLQRLAKSVGLTLKFIPVERWGDALELIERRQIDILQRVLKSRTQTASLNLTQSYIGDGAVPGVLYSRASTPQLTSRSELIGKKVGIKQHSNYAIYINTNHPMIGLINYSSNKEGLIALKTGKIDYYICNYLICESDVYPDFSPFVKANSRLSIIDSNFSDQLHYAIRSDWPILLSIINKAMAQLSPETDISLKQKWFKKINEHRNVKGSLTQDENAWLAANDRLIFSARPDAFPYTFYDKDGRFYGIASDILERIKTDLHIEAFSQRNMNFEETIDALRSGTIDFVPGMAITQSRKRLFLFSEPYLIEKLHIISTNKQLRFDQIGFGSDFTFSVVHGSAIEEIIKSQYPSANLVKYENINDAANAVLTGKADAILETKNMFNYLLKQPRYNVLSIISPTDLVISRAFAVNKDSVELLSILNKSLGTLTDREMTLLNNKWRSFQVFQNKDWKAIITFSIIISLVATSAAGIMLYFHRNKALKLITESQQQLKNAQRMAKLGSWKWDVKSNILHLSEEASRILGLIQSKNLNRSGYTRLIHPEDVSNVEKLWRQGLRDGAYQSTHRVVIDSEEKWLKEVSEIHMDSNGIPYAAAGTLQDITLQKSNELQLEQNANELRLLTNKLLNLPEEERRRIARELHDDLSQRLAVLSIQLGNISLDDDLDKNSEILLTLKNSIIRLATDVHGLSRRLHPSILDDLGLIDALKSEITSFCEREGIATSVQLSPSFPKLISDVELTIFRVAQEALRNVAKYAAADHVAVSLNRINDTAILQVTDNGVGFDYKIASMSPGLGLQSMSERAKLIDGKLNITSAENQGTTIELQVPITFANIT
jgi:PAS domain S-box-containing protein